MVLALTILKSNSRKSLKNEAENFSISHVTGGKTFLTE